MLTHGEPALHAFIENLNCHHPTIKFIASWSTKETIFLDVRVYLRDGPIGTDLYVKPTGKHQFFHMDRSHQKRFKIVPDKSSQKMKSFFKKVRNL